MPNSKHDRRTPDQLVNDDPVSRGLDFPRAGLHPRLAQLCKVVQRAASGLDLFNRARSFNRIIACYEPIDVVQIIDRRISKLDQVTLRVRNSVER